MTLAFKFIIDRIIDVIDLLDSDAFSFEFFGFNVSYWGLIFAFIVVFMIANVWWKGAKG